MTRIFLVEDDKAIAKNLTLLLRSEGFTVSHAATRGEASAMLAGNLFDLALDVYKRQILLHFFH